jgi:hypothetical protein
MEYSFHLGAATSFGEGISYHWIVHQDCFTIRRMVASHKSSTTSTGSSSSTLDPEISKTKARDCGSKNLSEEELSTLVQLVDKFKPAGHTSGTNWIVRLVE